jgi:hypothetical protein
MSKARSDFCIRYCFDGSGSIQLLLPLLDIPHGIAANDTPAEMASDGRMSGIVWGKAFSKNLTKALPIFPAESSRLIEKT